MLISIFIHFYLHFPHAIVYLSVCVEKHVMVPAFQGLNSHRSETYKSTDLSILEILFSTEDLLAEIMQSLENYKKKKYIALCNLGGQKM